MEKFANEKGITFTKNKELLEILFNSKITNNEINDFIIKEFKTERNIRKASEDELITELYKLKAFEWGGLHQNSLEKTIVDNYVKKIKSFDKLNVCIENELLHSMKSYVLSSWYNHWTSIIIEDIVKDNLKVLPAIGLIKKVDFFINDIPFDLKVTNLPEGFIKEERKKVSLRPELTILKQFCRNNSIHYSDDLQESKLLEDLWIKVKDHPSNDASSLISELKRQRLNILDKALKNPETLIRWLYENQGVRRFDASNRLFLILINCDNFFESWKLKRAKLLLIEKINSHLNSISGIP